MSDEKLYLQFMMSIKSLMRQPFYSHFFSSVQGENYVLNYLLEHGNNILPSNLSESMKVSTARVARMLNSLEKKCYITRNINSNDRRQIFVSLTDEGKCSAKSCILKYQNEIKRILDELGEDDTKDLIRILNRLTEITGKIDRH